MAQRNKTHYTSKLPRILFPPTCLLIQVRYGCFISDAPRALTRLIHVPDALDYMDYFLPPPEGPAIFQGGYRNRELQVVRLWGCHPEPRLLVDDPYFAFSIKEETNPRLKLTRRELELAIETPEMKKYELKQCLDYDV